MKLFLKIWVIFTIVTSLGFILSDLIKAYFNSEVIYFSSFFNSAIFTFIKTGLGALVSFIIWERIFNKKHSDKNRLTN